MVTNSPTLAVQINPGTLPPRVNCKGINKLHPEGMAQQPGCAVMFRLANVLQIPFKGPEGIVTQYWHGQKQNHGHPVVLNAVVTKPEVEYVKERMGQYPGVEFLATYQRAYTPYSMDASNILGHVGPITKEWLHSRFNRPRYLPRTGTMGQGGIELTYDRWLRGTDGKVAQVFDASGNPVGRSVSRRSGTAGLDAQADHRQWPAEGGGAGDPARHQRGSGQRRLRGRRRRDRGHQPRHRRDPGPGHASYLQAHHLGAALPRPGLGAEKGRGGGQGSEPVLAAFGSGGVRPIPGRVDRSSRSPPPRPGMRASSGRAARSTAAASSSRLSTTIAAARCSTTSARPRATSICRGR